MRFILHIAGFPLHLRTSDGKGIADQAELYQVLQHRSRVTPHEAELLADVLTGR